MKYITLKKCETQNGKKVEIAHQDHFPIAETIADVLAMETEDNGWNKDEIIACFNYGSRVKRQTQLGADAEAPTFVKLFKTQTPAEQEAMLRKHGLIKDGLANDEFVSNEMLPEDDAPVIN